MTAAYVADTDRLGLGRPDFEPLASEAIDGMIGLIGRLIEGGHAYAVDGDVYFSVRSYPEYGRLSHRNVDDMDQGEAIEGAELKRDPLDFALWKAHKPGEDTAWESPWGRGRPGWHIECSAMSEAILGLDFDIHGGGSDLIFPHHENEEAQTHAAEGTPLARLWVHNGMVRLQEAKMAKSVGNIFLLHEALDAYGRDALIMYFCSGHYRQPIEFDDERLEQARASVRRVREAARGLVPGADSPAWSGPLKESFFAALADDFNTPAALAAVFEWIREANRAEPGRRRLRGSRRDARGVCARETCSSPQTVAGAAAGAGARGARGRPRGRRGTSPRPTVCATSSGRSAGRSGTAPAGRSCSRSERPVIVYGRNPVREAIRGPRTVRRVWASRGALREPWLAGLDDRGGRGLRRRARAARGLPGPPGRVRRRVRVSLRRRGRAAGRAATRCSSRSTRSRTPRTSARSRGRPSAPARPGS